MKTKILKFKEFLNENQFKRHASGTDEEGKEHVKSYTDKNVSFKYWDDSRTIVLGSTAKFSNGAEIYDVAFKYLKSIRKETDGGDLEVFFVNNKFILVGTNGRKTISIEELKEFSDKNKI